VEGEAGDWDGEMNSPVHRSGAARLGRRPLRGGEESAG
jgi:hypothetical protein